jgi:hypothetical protein
MRSEDGSWRSKRQMRIKFQRRAIQAAREEAGRVARRFARADRARQKEVNQRSAIPTPLDCPSLRAPSDSLFRPLLREVLCGGDCVGESEFRSVGVCFRLP